MAPKIAAAIGVSHGRSFVPMTSAAPTARYEIGPVMNRCVAARGIVSRIRNK